MALKGILFDLDGTLVDSLSATFESFNHAILLHGGRKHTDEEILAYFGPWEGDIFESILGPGTGPSAYAALCEHVNANTHRMPLHRGIPELLASLEESKIPVSVVTGRSWNTTEIILRHHGLLDRFVTIVAGDHVNSPKPSPEGLRKALAKMSIDPAEACYVGDSQADTYAAQRAGCIAVAAAWDLAFNRAALEQAKPDHWAQSPAEILTILTRLAN